MIKEGQRPEDKIVHSFAFFLMGDLGKSIIVMKSTFILVFLLVNITITFHWCLQNVGAISCCLPESYASITVLAI